MKRLNIYPAKSSQNSILKFIICKSLFGSFNKYSMIFNIKFLHLPYPFDSPYISKTE